MEYRKINDNAVQCIITKEDMEDFGLTIVDIFERNEKGERFLREVIENALEEVDCEMNGGNIAMQIAPTPDKGLIITFSDEGPAAFKELLEHVKQALIGSGMDVQKAMENFRKGQSILDSEKEDQVQETQEAIPSKPKQGEKTENQTRILAFYAMADVISFSKVAFGERRMGSTLYKLDDIYYLVMTKKRLSQKDFNKLSSQGVEFADPVRFGDRYLEYLEEHAECIIPTQAIGKLKKIG